MGNCFKIQLKESVQNDNLNYFGYVTLRIKVPQSLVNNGICQTNLELSQIRCLTEDTEFYKTGEYVLVGQHESNDLVFLFDKYACTKFRVLNTITSINTDAIFDFINLQEIRFNGKLGEIYTTDICKLSNLEIITIDTDNYPNINGSLDNLFSLSRLQTLDLNHCSKITGSALDLVNEFPLLTSLNLSNCTNITDKTADTKTAIEATHPGITIQW